MQNNNATVEHIESRPSKKKSKSTYEIYFELKSRFSSLIKIVKTLKENEAFPDVVILDAVNGEQKTGI